MSRQKVTIDGNEAAAYVAHHLSEVIAIYPITPSSPMGELADSWSARGQKNIWGTIPDVTEMQSEGGAAGAVHGALQGGSLSTTFTASQGLLLMIPNMYKIAGELTSTVFHVSARSLAMHALSIFGDHSDVMACRQTGFALLASGSVQEVMDNALIAHSASLASRIPFLHFFDGFRTSHELMKVERLTADDMREMIDDDKVFEHRSRALSPDRPVIRGTAQNPDVYFQARETVNSYYQKTPAIVQAAMDKFAAVVGRQYHLFDYVGHPEAERVIVMMGSGAEAAHEAVDYLAQKQGEKVGLIKVRLYRPFSIEHFIQAIPKTTTSMAVLDRTKEPGAVGEPLYQDVITAFSESGGINGKIPKVIGGRYGLSSKEFTPAMTRAVFDELAKASPKNHFTVGINDDVTHSSLDYDPSFCTEDKEGFRGVFIGLGADGTVGANKNSIKIIGEETDNYAQGYFVYDSKKSGSMTKSYLRFGKQPIYSTYLTRKANFIACHQFNFVEKLDLLDIAEEGATLLLNSPYSAEEMWDHLPRITQQRIVDNKIKLYVIDAYSVAEKAEMGVRINTIMQTCFFAIANILPRDEAIDKIKGAIKKTFGKKGDEIVQKNYNAVDSALAHLHQVEVPEAATSQVELPPVVSDQAPEFVQKVTAEIMAGRGDDLPVSAMPVDGTFPTATTKWEKRNVAQSVPVWDPDVCIQCGKCSFVCPHGTIRMKMYNQSELENAPAAFKSAPAKGKNWPENSMCTIQVAIEDCTGCGLCIEACPAKNKEKEGAKAINLAPQLPLRDVERENWSFFEKLPVYNRTVLKTNTVKESQLLEPLFEFSGACAGCGETAYVKLVSQLFGDRMLIANATGCSSIYGGNLPTTPYCQDSEGRGPTWSNSLFEDNAEFGLGMRLAVDKKNKQAQELLTELSGDLKAGLAESVLNADQQDETGIKEQRQRVEELKAALEGLGTDSARHLLSLADYLVKKSVWIVGGDGWGYDIGYGGLDHVLASGRNVNVLLLDTEVYSNTGGQMSKSTPMGAVAKFAAAGKQAPKKDLGLLAMSYGTIYVAKVAMGSSDSQTLKAIIEAEKYDGPSLIIAYSHCIAHGYNLKFGLAQQKLAVDCGHWPLYRYNPDLIKAGKNPFQLDSKAPKIPLKDYIYNETRYKMLAKADPDRAAALAEQAQVLINRTWDYYQGLASMEVGD
jgi:pyruvate-ferredoxin/flavodoxin oxidoreductase